MRLLKSIIIATLLFGFRFGFCQIIESPQTEITNGIIKAQLYLPDNENGYYKGTRFDWSGVISNLEYNGHTYFGLWFDKANQPSNSIIMGPVEAYAPLNYENVAIGDGFVKIGVGVLKKETNETYSEYKLYTIVDPGTWTIKKKKNEVQFVQTINHDKISIEYSKTIKLVKNKPEMIIIHSLKNIGKITVETSGYNHNFFVVDNQSIGKGFELSFPKIVSGTGRGLGDIFDIQEKKVVINRNVKQDESFACRYLEGINNNVTDFIINTDNFNTGAGVKITGDQPLSRLRLWGNSKTICPETYIDIKVDPGEEFSWSYTYEFYISKTVKQ